MPRETARADILLNNMFLHMKIDLVKNLKIRNFLRCDNLELRQDVQIITQVLTIITIWNIYVYEPK